MRGISIYSGNAPGMLSPRAAAAAAAVFSTAAWPGIFRVVRGLGQWWSFSSDGASWPCALAYSSGRWRGDGVMIRVEGQGEISYAQTITMGSKPQNIYLFRLNGSIKWTPAMFLAWITGLRGTHKCSAVTPSCSLMYQIQCLGFSAWAKC